MSGAAVKAKTDSGVRKSVVAEKSYAGHSAKVLKCLKRIPESRYKKLLLFFLVNSYPSRLNNPKT